MFINTKFSIRQSLALTVIVGLSVPSCIRLILMNPFFRFVFFAALTLGTALHAQLEAGDEKKTIELTIDNPETLIGTTSNDFTLYGLRLGMSQEEAWQVLQTLDGLVAEKDPQHPFILVFKKGASERTFITALFSLNWESGPRSPVITLTHRCAELLPPNLQRLFKEANSERPSAFVDKFLGPVSSRKTDRKYQKSGTTIYLASYDAIGLIVQRTQSRSGSQVSLRLTEATERPNAAAQVREWADDTGKFKVRAALVKVADGKVTLRKEDGKEIVVTLARLSAADRDFLKQHE
jgi:hypothetical protein